ncbi:MAG: 4Fe-4S dicluster domain-containing protein [Clostridia bacterium]|nr:4Fe-4S dicluster domain-containing protein [Clostridia bacterium]
MEALYREKQECFGCEACVAACHTGAISMKTDLEGFLYPTIDTLRCTECGRCIAVCPAKVELPRREGKFFAVRCDDEQVLFRSTSGGAFTLLAQDVIARDGLVCGAVFDDTFSVRHILSKSISLMRKSKYVQSTLAGCYASIQEALCRGATVLFSGTPCQCHALRLFFSKYLDHLLLVSVVCRGVQSPGLWRDYTTWISCGGSLQFYDFRDKRDRNDGHTVAYAVNGVETSVPMTADRLSSLFNLGLTYRPSCYACPYTRPDNDFDLTLGDFWGVEKSCPQFADHCGTSLVIAHGTRGEACVSRLVQRAKIVACEGHSAMQPALVAPAREPFLRKFLFRDFARAKAKGDNSMPLILKKYGVGQQNTTKK